MKKNKEENMISFIFQFRNKLNALLGDDPQFTILEVDEPLPTGDIVVRENAHTLNVICSDVAKLIIARDHIGDCYENGEKLYIDYYFGRTLNGNSFVNIKDRPSVNSPMDIAMLFKDNPHFSEFYTGWGLFGPWACVAFKPELIQYHNDDATSLHGRKSCAMEDIAREIFINEIDNKIFFSTENIEDFCLVDAESFPF